MTRRCQTDEPSQHLHRHRPDLRPLNPPRRTSAQTPVTSGDSESWRGWRQAGDRYDRRVTLLVPVPTSARQALRLAALIVVLAGVFGMHGLSGQASALGSGQGSGGSGGHGAAGMSMATVPPALMAASTAPSMSMDSSGLAAIPTGTVSDLGLFASNVAEDLREGATGSGHGTDSGGMAMGAMCLAILGAALLTLLRLLRQARGAPEVWSLPRPARAIVPRGRDPDPPCLITLSIQRC